MGTIFVMRSPENPFQIKYLKSKGLHITILEIFINGLPSLKGMNINGEIKTNRFLHGKTTGTFPLIFNGIFYLEMMTLYLI